MNVKDKLGLLGATILTLGMGGVTPALAQDAPAASEDDVIVVTGSRLRRETFESPNPTFQVGSQQMDAAQTANTIDALEDIPLVGIGSNNRGTQVQNGDSFAFPDVLDLGTQRTLTLLNGRRVVANNQGTVFVPGNASGSQVDLSMINPQVIDRVEVLAGTGGAIYGADAVAGVVNIITKDDYEGLDLRGSVGLPELGEGNTYRASVLWGANLFDDRANITISADYLQQEAIFTSDTNSVQYTNILSTNMLNGGVRRSGSLDIATAISTTGACPSIAACNTALAGLSAFLPAASDGQATNFLGPLNLYNPLIAPGGALLTGPGPLAAGFTTTTPLVPGVTIHPELARVGVVTSLDPNGWASFAPTSLGSLDNAATRSAILTSFGVTGAQIAAMTNQQESALTLALLQRNRMTPYEYFAANPGLDPMLFYGTFGSFRPDTGVVNRTNGYFPTIINTDVATAALFPRRAVPLQFNEGGELVAYNPGVLTPPLQGLIGAGYNGDGYDPFREGYIQNQAGTERMSFTMMGHYDITDNLRLRTEILYTNAIFDQSQAPQTNVTTGSPQGSGLNVPIFIDQNPFLGSTNRNLLHNLENQGLSFPTIAGNDVMYLSRALYDVVGGGLTSETEVTTYRIAQVIEGDFSVMDRAFYWDVAAIYGRSEADNRRRDIGDIEFALAADVVTGPGGQPVCRQQTLGAPESVVLRNPLLSSIVIGSPLTPSADQVSRCVPLNLFGTGDITAAARDYILVDASSHNLNSQEAVSASLGGELFRLPGGSVSIGLNAEYRKESAEFEPSPGLSAGTGRTALQSRGSGFVEFVEYGYEVLIPVFGEGFNFPLMQSLDLQYAFRIVDRSQESETALSNGEGTTDDTFNYSFTWKPFDDVSIRGARSRTVRSASLVELLGPGTVAFTAPGVGHHPCAGTNLPAGASTRRTNCETAVLRLGIVPSVDPLNPTALERTAASTWIGANFGTGTDVGGTRSAVAIGNPNLANEEANAYTYGITYEPSFIPRLTLAADFFSVDMIQQIGLVGGVSLMSTCFDSASFPNVPIGGINSCDQVLFGVDAGGGNFVVPGVNAVTGNPGFSPAALVGTPAFSNTPFVVTLVSFNNINSGGLQMRGSNFEARYNFGLEELPIVGGAMDGWGDIFLRTSLFHTQRYDNYADINLSSLTDRSVGEHPGLGSFPLSTVGSGLGNPEYELRTDIRHRIGPFDHTLQWFWNSATVTDIVRPKEQIADQSLAFSADDLHYFNYLASYDITDALTLRLTVNNLTDTDDPRGAYGIGSQFDGGLGREWVVGFQARF